MEEETTRGVSFSFDVTGEAEIDLEDIVGDRPLEDVNQEKSESYAESIIDGCELRVDIDGLPFIIRLHVN
jgi:hypothetical protein